MADALAAAHQIDDGKLKAQALDLVATAQAQSGDITGAKQTAGSIVVDTSGDSAVADIETGFKNDAYGAIAGGQAETGDVDGARATAAGIQDSEAKELAYQYIAQALARKGDISGAKSFAEQASGPHQIQADVTIAGAEAADGNIDDAIAIAKAMDDSYQRVQALSLIAQAQAKAGYVTAARHTIELAMTAAPDVEDCFARATYSAIATAMVQAGDLDGANNLRKFDGWIISQIAIAQADMGDIAGARATIPQISDPYGLACANASLALALCRARNGPDAREAFGAARSAATSISESTDAAEACGRIASVQAKYGDSSAAADWARSQQDQFVEVSALISVARTLETVSKRR